MCCFRVKVVVICSCLQELYLYAKWSFGHWILETKNFSQHLLRFHLNLVVL